MDQLKSAGKY